MYYATTKYFSVDSTKQKNLVTQVSWTNIHRPADSDSHLFLEGFQRDSIYLNLSSSLYALSTTTRLSVTLSSVNPSNGGKYIPFWGYSRLGDSGFLKPQQRQILSLIGIS